MELEFAKMQQPRDNTGSVYFSFIGQRSNSMKSLALEAIDPLDKVTTLLEFETLKSLLVISKYLRTSTRFLSTKNESLVKK